MSALTARPVVVAMMGATPAPPVTEIARAARVSVARVCQIMADYPADRRAWGIRRGRLCEHCGGRKHPADAMCGECRKGWDIYNAPDAED